MVISRTLQKLRAGDVIWTAVLSRVPEPWLAEVIGRLGFDLVWLDMEHRCFGYGVIGPLALACRSTSVDLMVRILKTGYTSAMRVLEAGASGVMIPHCRSADEARQWVDWTRFYPMGKRGFDGSGADADYGAANPIEYMKCANEQIFLVVQIEDREAVDCVEEIVKTEGVDVLFVGPADLSISYGVPLQFDHLDVRRAIDRVANAALKVGKWWGMPSWSQQMTGEALSRGARMIAVANDHRLLVKGFESALKEVSQVGS